MSSNAEGASSSRIGEDQGIVLESPYLAVRNPSGSSLRPRFEDGGAVMAESFGRRLDLRSPDGSVSVAHQEETSVISRSDPATGQVDYHLETRSSLSASSRSDPSRGSGSDRAESTEVHEATRLVVATTNIPVYNHGSGVVNTNNWHSGNTTTTIVKNVVTNNHYYGPPPPPPPPPPPQSSPPVASQQTQNESNACPTPQNEVRGPDSERTRDSEKPALDPTQPDPHVSSSGSIKGFFKDFLSSRSSRSTREGRDIHLYLQEFDKKKLPKFTDKWVEYYVQGSKIGSFFSSLAIPLFVPYHPRSDKYPSGQRLTFPTIGDVGFFDELGGFTTLFNLRYSKKINEELCFAPPDSFQPLPEGVLEGKTISHYKADYPDKSFELVESDQDADSSTYFGLKRSSQSGAILFTPDGSLKRFFHDPGRLNSTAQEYFSTQVIEWYRHLRSNLGYVNKGNGELLLISGAYLVKTWAVASFHAAEKTQVPFKVKLLEVKDGLPRHQWVNANMHYASGPNNEHPHHTNLDPLDRDYSGCVGVEVLSVACDKETWQADFGGSRGPSRTGSIFSVGSSLRSASFRSGSSSRR